MEKQISYMMFNELSTLKLEFKKVETESSVTKASLDILEKKFPDDFAAQMENKILSKVSEWQKDG